MLIDHLQGNYRFLRGIAPYSSGVAAMPGFEIIRAKMLRPLPLKMGLEKIVHFLNSIDRPSQAICAMELRIPAPLSFPGFMEFNQSYQAVLNRWGLLLDDMNPIARTNVAPAILQPAEPILYAFSYTVPAINQHTFPTFIIAGAGDLVDQSDLSPTAIIRPGEDTVDALKEKASTVMQVMQERLDGLLLKWEDVTSLNVYTSYSIRSFLVDTIYSPIGEAVRHGVNWYFCNPPIQGLAFEMDARGVRQELCIDIQN
ncbi:MAG: RidA family protein [Saprospiraceae bacterium]|nr:RidA family protein [Saprospiraceae bacterium]